jgi:hypothetical protein
MAIVIAPNDIVRTTIKFLHPYGSSIQNVFHFIMEGVGTADGEDVHGAIVAWLDNAWGNLEPYITDALAAYEVTTKLINFFAASEPGWHPVADLGYSGGLPTFTPTNVADVLPPAVSALVRFPTGYTKHEKRTYVGGFVETDNDSDAKQLAAQVAALLTFSEDLYTSTTVLVSGQDLTPVVPDVNDELYKYYSASVVPSSWHYQRRRQLLVGV